MKIRLMQLGLSAVLAGGLVGCADENLASEKPAIDDTKGTGVGGKAEAWGAADSPTLFNGTLEYKVSALPQTGQVTSIPWASSYWPYYEDSINYKWDGASSDSAPKKYEKAFGITGVEDAVSAFRGIDSVSTRKACTVTSECEDLKDGSVCAIRDGKTSGRCIPTWWGICPAWTAASILQAEPKNPVTRNGVTFKVNDIKALLTLVHENNVTTKFVSLRCNKEDARDGLPAGSVIDYDAYGRPVDADRECRDSNAGTYHVLLTNYLGMMKQSFAEDRTNNYEVWNQPLRGYRITKQQEVTAQEANRLIGVTTAGGTTTERTGTVAKDAWSHLGSFAVTAGQSTKVVMTGDNDADLYVNFGSEPTAAAYACRPYGSSSAEECELTVPAGATQLFVSVNGYAASSNFKVTITTGGSTPSSYVFNANAKKFYSVTAEVDYIGESSPNTDGNLSSVINQYTHTDHYDYVLEVDANDKIIGGEWVGQSKKSHPDFLWLPGTIASNATTASGKITYANVKSILDESLGSAPTTGTEKTVTVTGTVAKGVWTQYGPYNLAAGATLTATMTGDNDADLYVRKNAAPSAQSYDCRPYKSGSSESCSIVGPATVYVAANGYATSSNYQIVIKYKEGTGTVVTPPVTTFTHLSSSGSVALNEMKLFQLPINAGRKVVVRTTSAADIDLYIQFDGAPTTAAYNARGYTASGNETLTFTATSNGTLYIGVHGYEAGAFTVATTDN